jgi:Domain of unknown function (DUF5134)
VTMSPWVTHAGMAAMVAVVVFYSLRIGVGVLRRTALSWDAELTHLGMGLAMAGMFDRTIAVVPPQAWLVFFGVAGAWFAVRSSLAARRQLSGQLVGGALVHVGGCAAMAYMLVVVPPGGNMVNMADLICGARMVGMQATESGSVVTPWTGLAIAIAVVLLAGGASAVLPRFRTLEGGQSMELGSSGVAGLTRTLRSTRVALGAQVTMCLVMTAMLVAMYR